MRAVLPLGIVAAVMAVCAIALAASNLSRPDTLGMIREAEAVGARLAAACYREGVAKGDLAATARRVEESGGKLSDSTTKLLAEGPTKGCREQPSR